MDIPYTGICVSRLRDGTINTVRVRLSDGGEVEIDPRSYFANGAQPPIHILPDCSATAHTEHNI